MKKSYLKILIPVFIGLTLILGAVLFNKKDNQSGIYQPKVGDIYFQSLPKLPIVIAIEGATESPYSHCGILDQVDGEWFVIESIGKVKVTPLQKWIDRGREDQYDVYRLKKKYRRKMENFIEESRTYLERPYDIQYDFDDEKIYCSELVFKAFKSVYDENLGEVVTLGDLKWQPYELLIRIIDPTLPLEREMITPRHLSEAEQLDIVFKTMTTEEQSGQGTI